jgi:hypothetical protein
MELPEPVGPQAACRLPAQIIPLSHAHFFGCARDRVGFRWWVPLEIFTVPDFMFPDGLDEESWKMSQPEFFLQPD